MQDLIVTETFTTAASLAAFVALGAAEDGKVGVFLADGTLRTAALTNGQVFQIAQKRGASGIFLSSLYTFSTDKNIFSAVKLDAQAPAAQVATVAVTGTAGSVGKVFEVSIADLTEMSQPMTIERYSYTAAASTDTPTIIAAGIVANWSAKNQRAIFGGNGIVSQFTLSASTGTLTITSTDVRTAFKVTISGFSGTSGATVGGTARVEGSGRGEYIVQAEREMDQKEGLDVTNTLREESWGIDNRYAKASELYDGILLEMVKSRDSKDRPLQLETFKQRFGFAIKSGGAAYTTLKTVFGIA